MRIEEQELTVPQISSLIRGLKIIESMRFGGIAMMQVGKCLNSYKESTTLYQQAVDKLRKGGEVDGHPEIIEMNRVKHKVLVPYFTMKELEDWMKLYAGGINPFEPTAQFYVLLEEYIKIEEAEE